MFKETYKNLTEKQAIDAFHATARLKGISVRAFSLERSGPRGRVITIRQKSRGTN